MHPESLSISRHVPRSVAVAVLVILALAALVLLVSVVGALDAVGMAPADDPRLAPFRWTPLRAGLA
jgi:hypothetical protein